jgi:hypothetical protein
MSRHTVVISAMLFGALSMSGLAYSADFSVGMHMGYKGGASFGASGMVSEFAQGFPLALEFGLTYSSLDPGDPLRARRVFIANATNGTPEKSGRTWDLKMEFLYNLHLSGLRAMYLYAGGRYSSFDGHFHYVGANEEFDVTGAQWGVSLGSRVLFAMSSRVSMMLSGGVVAYFKGSLHGHDTTYSPDNQNVNPKENFQYSDAASAVSTPRFQPEVLIGVAYTL